MFAAQNRQHVVQNVDSFNCGGRVSSTFFNRRFQRRMSLGCCSPCRSFQSKKQNSYLSSSSSHEGGQHKQQQSINEHIQFRGTNVSTISRRRKLSSIVVVRVSSESSSSSCAFGCKRLLNRSLWSLVSLCGAQICSKIFSLLLLQKKHKKLIDAHLQRMLGGDWGPRVHHSMWTSVLCVVLSLLHYCLRRC